MVDPLAEVVTLLQPGAPFSKLVSGAGRWSVSRSEYGQPFFCVILHGAARLTVDGLSASSKDPAPPGPAPHASGWH